MLWGVTVGRDAARGRVMTGSRGRDMARFAARDMGMAREK